MDLHKLSLGLAALKDGLDELERQCTAEAGACMALRQAASASQQQRAGLLKQVSATQAQVFTAQDECDDLQTLLECLRCQLAAAEGARTALQDEVAALEAEAARFVDGFEARCVAFSAAFAPGRLAQQQADIKAEAAAAEAGVRGALQAYRAERRALLAQQAAVKELRQQAADRHAALVEVKQQVAAESAMASTLAAQLLEAQQQGPAARQLAQLQASVAEREAGVLNQQCSVARQEVELGRLQMEVKHRHQDVARKTARLEELNRTVHALGLPPVATSAGACGFPAAPQHHPGATPHMQPAAAAAAPPPPPQQLPYLVEEPPSDDDDTPHAATHDASDQGTHDGGYAPAPAAPLRPPPVTRGPPPPPAAAAAAAGSSVPRGRRVLMQETVVLHSVQGAPAAAAQGHGQVVQTRHVVVQQELLGGGMGPAGDGVKQRGIILQSETTTTTTTTATAAAATRRGRVNTQRPPPPPPPQLLLPAAHAAPEVQPSPSVGHGGQPTTKAGRPRAAAKPAAAKSKAKAPGRRRKSAAQKQPPAQLGAGGDDMFGKGENY